MATAAKNRILNNQLLVIHCPGDSNTSNSATAWPYLLGQRLAGDFATAKVQWFDYWPGNPVQSPPPAQAIQAGSGSGADIRIIRDGVPGDTTALLLARSTGMFSTVHLVIMPIGINDANNCYSHSSYMSNLVAIAGKAKAANPACEILHIPPIWGDYPYGTVPTGYGYPAVYGELTTMVAIQEGHMVADVRKKRFLPHYNGNGPGGQDGWLSDQYHLTAAGHAAVVDEIMATVFA